ncbi:hypothetical protein QYM36_005473 [Artemia franciscana]|uniref:Saposin A-type domain-containing protein n=1 Tax=Artemia franciscana TaxID=6661 RepID=A0AA88L9T2_ARTSF|nr:hypothetical protein QYM36_005473 [Artemia franciscana]
MNDPSKAKTTPISSSMKTNSLMNRGHILFESKRESGYNMHGLLIRILIKLKTSLDASISRREICQAVIDTYGPYIASLIGQLASAHEVCEATDLCQKPGLVHMYGGEQCKLGAPYWCISEQHAKDCGCQAVIDTYGPYIASLIGRLASALEVCEAIDLCQKPGLVHMYGGEQCKLGAPYWCISEQHAKACGELDYCKKSVWKN